MADPIRLRVWLLVAVPVIALGGALFVFLRPEKKPAPHPTRTADESMEATSVSPPPPRAAGTAPALPPPPAASVVGKSAPVSSSDLLRGPPPEPIPELDAFNGRPRGSDEWSTEEKLAYRRKAFDDLQTKERSLRAEMMAAGRAGDTAKQAEKQATLRYLEARRAQVEDLLRRQEALEDGGR
jgi:hypothetical protein